MKIDRDRVVELIELIENVAYEQATRDFSGSEWLRDFLKKTYNMKYELKQLPEDKT